jgi:hypothetical protein
MPKPRDLATSRCGVVKRETFGDYRAIVARQPAGMLGIMTSISERERTRCAFGPIGRAPRRQFQRHGRQSVEPCDGDPARANGRVLHQR